MYTDNPIWLPYIYGLGGDTDSIKDIDIYDESLWYKCNPSLGVTIDIDTLRDEAKDAKGSPSMERLFRWLRLNQWISVKLVGWLPLSEWDATVREAPDLTGKKCWGGLDLSSTTDLTGFTLTFPIQEGLKFWYQLHFAWITEEKMKEREQRDGVPFGQWAADGYVYTTPGRSIDYEFVAEKILQMGRVYNIQWIGIDPWQAQFIEKMLTDNGVKVAEIPQDVKNISPAMKKYEKLILDRKLFHDGNPCARWCFGNVRLYTDANENYKADKGRSTERIDITVSAITSIAMHMAQPSRANIFYAPKI